MGRKSRAKVGRRASRGRTSQQQERVQPVAAVHPSRDPAKRLKRLAERQRAAQMELENEIRRLMGHGHSWSTVAEALGITRQGARQRYRRLLEPGSLDSG